jgi:hypothetical protein
VSFLGRVVESVTGRAKVRIPRELELLGAPADLVAEARTKPDIQQEELLLRFVQGKHAAILDWRARRDEIYDELEPLLTEEERRILPRREDVPDTQAETIVRLRRALSDTQRTVVHTESFGDFSFLFIVPRTCEAAFIACVGPWRIEDVSDA